MRLALWGMAAAVTVTAQYVPPPPSLASSAAVEQTAQGHRPALPVIQGFEGLGADLAAPGTTPRNPSDNSLAVGPSHVMQTVNSQIAIFSKLDGRLVYGPLPTNTMFAGSGEVCGSRPNGDAVVRYDQLANRWLVVMPIFRRVARGEPAPEGKPSNPGPAARPGPPPPLPSTPQPPVKDGTYAICYAVSATADPLGEYYRYVFDRPLFPDYPRPAVWPDGYYTPTSTGDDVIEKHVCVADRVRMLRGEPATEQCIVIDGVNFLNTADLDGTALPPAGAPNIVMATGGTQLRHDIDDDGIYAWKVFAD